MKVPGESVSGDKVADQKGEKEAEAMKQDKKLYPEAPPPSASPTGSVEVEMVRGWSWSWS